jgi:hypothetical protein
MTAAAACSQPRNSGLARGLVKRGDGGTPGAALAGASGVLAAALVTSPVALTYPQAYAQTEASTCVRLRESWSYSL